MAKKSNLGQIYRHAPAFILLFLAEEDLYGAALLNTMQKKLPYFNMDSAVIYRTLQDLEGEGAINSYWDTNVSGSPRKRYQISDKGFKRLAEFREDIEMRMRNFEFFLQSYQSILERNGGGV
jgi:PadR family transcriptional regulator PadR